MQYSTPTGSVRYRSLTNQSQPRWAEVAVDKEKVTSTISPISAVRLQVSSDRQIRAIPLEDRSQLPFMSLLVAAVVSGAMWWGIIAGLHWIWQNA